MLRRSFMQRSIIALFLLACLLLLSSTSLAFATPATKKPKSSKFSPTTIFQQDQQLPITRYLALDDSLAYGFQPNNDHAQGYVDDLSTDLQSQGITSHVNLGCPRETTSTFIAGGECSYPLKSQLAMALAYLQQQSAGQATLVTLDIGANDVLNYVKIDVKNKTCTAAMQMFNTDLQTIDQNLTQSILPQLHAALIGSNGQSTGNLVLLNYYNPFQNICPNTLSLMRTLNTHLSRDIAGFGTLVDIFGAFGGSTTPNPNLCNYTWMCSAPPLGPDIHPTAKGYQVMASAIENQNLFQANPSGVNDQDFQGFLQVKPNVIFDQKFLKLFSKFLHCKGDKGCEGSNND